MIKTDIFLEIGSQHKVCEDYILKYGDDTIILADGCSNSKNSEMGARILCYMAKQFLKLNGFSPHSLPDEMGSWIIHNAEMTSRHMGLTKSCLDATLIIAKVRHNNLHVNMYGDGFIILQPNRKYASKINYEINWVNYTQNMPYYLRYLIDKTAAIKYHGCKIHKTIHNYSVMDGGKSLESSYEQAYDIPTIFKFDMNMVETVSICSDGLASFLDPTDGPNSNKLIDIPSLLPETLGFKGTAGEFLKRRMNKFSKELKKNGIEHYDDLSIGTFLREE